MYYVDKKQGGTNILPLEIPLNQLEQLDQSCLFATAVGASRHPKADPFTPIKITIENVYDGVEWLAADCCDPSQLTPVGTIAIIEIESQ